MSPIKVVIHGASGRVGRVLIDTLYHEPEVKLVGAVDLKASGGEIVPGDGSKIPFSRDLDQIIRATSPEVVVDFTLASATLPAVRVATSHKINLVIGTTGLTAVEVEEIERLVKAAQVGCIMASNFTIGAILMGYFARIGAKYMDFAEIIELHHETKVDAPSGTAVNTARSMAAYRGKPFSQAVDQGKNYASRGQDVSGVHIHSVRLPGLMAHQEVILGGPGQTLTIRHDTINRECYVPGVLLAIREVVKRQGFVQGLESLLGL